MGHRVELKTPMSNAQAEYMRTFRQNNKTTDIVVLPNGDMAFETYGGWWCGADHISKISIPKGEPVPAGVEVVYKTVSLSERIANAK